MFITCNANTANQFEKVLLQLRYQVEAPVVLGQELQLAPKQVELLSARLIKYGWKAAVVPSAPTKQGMRAGVMIAVPSRMGITYLPELMKWGASPTESPGRLCVGYVKTCRKHGIAVGSVHLWVAEGPSNRNLTILSRFGAPMAVAGQPWVLGGDFNMEPHELMSTGIITKLKGHLVYDMSEGTCRGSTGNYSVRDYFIVSESLLENGLRAEVMAAFAAKPHM